MPSGKLAPAAHHLSQALGSTGVRSAIFDVDHTLVRYKLGSLYRLVYMCFADYLVANKGYDAALKAIHPEKWGVMRGLVLDAQTGDLLLINEAGTVVRAVHGEDRALTSLQIRAAYGDRPWREFQALREGRVTGPDYFAFTTGFDAALSQLCGRLVDLADSTGSGRPYTFLSDVKEAVGHVFGQPCFSRGTGGFFAALRADPDLYLHRRARVREYLEQLRSAGVRLALVTNSHADFATFTMEHALGPGAMNLFSWCFVNAAKPGWFAQALPAKALVWSKDKSTGIEGSVDGAVVESMHLLQPPQSFAGGCLDAVRSLVDTAGDRAVYVGDHCHGEIVPAALAGLKTIAVVEETEGGELYEPQRWGASFWTAAEAGVEASGASSKTWLASTLQNAADLVVNDLEVLSTGIGFSHSWRSGLTPPGLGPGQ